MSEKTSKVTKVTQNVRSFDSKFGKMFVHAIETDAGDVGEYSSKTEQCKAFTVGAEATYTVEANGTFPDKIKPVMNKGNFGGGNAGGGNSFQGKPQEVITALSCLSSAATLYSLQKAVTVEQVIATADAFYTFAMSKVPVEPIKP